MGLSLRLGLGLDVKTGGGVTIAGLLGTNASAGYWKPSNASTLWQDGFKTTAAGDGDPVRVVDASGGGAGQIDTSSDGNRLTLDITGGISSFVYPETGGYQFRMDEADFSGLGNALVMVAVKIDATDTVGAIAQYAAPTGYLGRYQDGSVTSAIDTTGTRYLDGDASPASNLDEFFHEIDDGAWHVYEARGVVMNAGQTLMYFPAATIRGTGNLGPMLVAPMALVSDNLDAIRTEIGAEVGLSL